MPIAMWNCSSLSFVSFVSPHESLYDGENYHDLVTAMLSLWSEACPTLNRVILLDNSEWVLSGEHWRKENSRRTPWRAHILLMGGSPEIFFEIQTGEGGS